MSEPRLVLVTSRSFGSGRLDLERRLGEDEARVVRGPPDHDLDALRDPLAAADAWIAGTGPITQAHLELAPRLRVIARYGVGVDSVDLAAAAERGIIVTNTPGANTEAVADHALALLLSLLRGVVAGDRRLRDGDWSPIRGRELASLTVGIAGFGRIGQAVARRLGALGCRLLAFDPLAPPRQAGVSSAAWIELARRCDAVTLHAPGGRRLVDAAWLAAVGPRCLLVNTARADLVDEPAVADALREDRLGGYAADALAAEAGRPAGPLLAADLSDRVIVTPHVAAQTVEAIDRMGAMAVADVLAALDDATPDHRVASAT